MCGINSLPLSGPEPSQYSRSRLRAFPVDEKSLVVVLDRLIEHSFHYNPPPRAPLISRFCRSCFFIFLWSSSFHSMSSLFWTKECELIFCQAAPSDYSEQNERLQRALLLHSCLASPFLVPGSYLTVKKKKVPICKFNFVNSLYTL